jgi:hypothetical protein
LLHQFWQTQVLFAGTFVGFHQPLLYKYLVVPSTVFSLDTSNRQKPPSNSQTEPLFTQEHCRHVSATTSSSRNTTPSAAFSAAEDRRQNSRLGCNTRMAERNHHSHLLGGKDIPLP